MKGGMKDPLPPRKRPWRMYVALTFGVAVVVLVAVLPTALWPLAMSSAMVGNCSARLEDLDKALAIANQSLTKAHGQRDDCKRQLSLLQGKALELEEALHNVSRLQGENRALQAEVAQQQQQLEDLQGSRDWLQQQNQHLQQQLQVMRSLYSDGTRLPDASLCLLVLLLTRMLLL
ncbi:uncharacterized protein ACIB01_018034 [Guaruba guarouba]